MLQIGGADPILLTELEAMPENEIKTLKSEVKTKTARLDENAVCEVCGKFDAHQLGEQFLCADCYQASGSCCSGEFQKQDGE